MKPIIIEMKNMNDSTEVYNSKPNRFLIYTIYLILIILLVAILWMALFKMDIVVKSNGIFRESSCVYEISSNVTGNVKETYIQNGQYISEGDVLYTISVDELSDTIMRYQEELESVNDRLTILSAYEKSLDGDVTELETLTNNRYYDEFINRKNLLYINTNLNESDISNQIALYQENIDCINTSITQYNEKINKLNIVKQCIVNRNNTFDTSEEISYSLVSSYLATYDYTTLQYDNQISEYQRQIDDYNEQINNIETLENIDVENLKKQRDILISTQESIQKEKEQALINLELQQIGSIEQEIAGYNDTIISLENNLMSAKLQLDSINNADSKDAKTATILTEKGNIATEILTYEEKKKEYETYLKSYEIQNDNCIIKANTTGYYYALEELKTGSFIQEGTTIGMIYPETESKYYAEIYVQNTDIAKVQEGQEVKFEIAAYPSSEYGYFEGVIENIAKDISLDQSTGYSYYLVRVKCEEVTLKGKTGEEATLINGMACQAKIVVDEKNVLTYLLEKIDLLD